MQLVDIPGVPVESGAEKLNAFLTHAREVDAICEVVRCFDDGRPVEAQADIDRMESELVLADLIVAEGARDKAKRSARGGDPETKARLELLEKVLEPLNDGRPIRSVEAWADTERALLRSYGMITAKPVLYVANITEDDLGGEPAEATAVARHAEATGGQTVSICAALEAELAELEEADRQEMLASLGLSESAIGPLARALNRLLGLGVFYTAGPKEVRAWPVEIGAPAPEAAGGIHTDMQRGFIRAECYHVDELVEHESEKAIRDAGKLRSEGKHYQLQDGDVVHFLFNV
jgi:GTP-binding protein YchF